MLPNISIAGGRNMTSSPTPAPAVASSVDKPVNILLVDDQPKNLLALEAILDTLGQNLVRAGSGAEALRCLLNDDFAVILLDVLMPGMDGFETATLIRERIKSQHTPIIFLTAVGDSQAHMFRGYSIGAVDYLLKPVVPEILRAKVAAFVDLFKKTEKVKRQAEQLREMERREHERKLAEAHERFEAERMRISIRLAREIQQKLFPASAPVCPGWSIHGASHPAEATGGDYFDYIPFVDGTIGIAIGDVSGHGFGPALLMAATRAYLRVLGQTDSDVARILTLANRALADDMLEGHFVTLLLARLDPAHRLLTYASAGHPAGYVLSRTGDVKARLESTGFPLGIAADIPLDAGSPIMLEPGELVCFVTDGVVEARGAGDKAFGVDRALEIVRVHRGEPAKEIVDALCNAVIAFAKGQLDADDVTAIVVKAEVT
ncbi:MAG: SpoIIE family protein phosphatase [Pirellulales bacterium]